MADCSCTSKYKNSGFPSCMGALIAAARKIIVVPRYADDGTLNKITLPATLNATFVNALLNNTDRSKRWYPLPKMVNVTMPKAETVYETFEDGSKQRIHEGIRTFAGTIPGMGPQYLKVLKSGNCTDIAMYFVDKNGALVGLTNGELNVLYPFVLNKGTIDAVMAWASDTTGTNLTLAFEFDADQKDENISLIGADQFTGVNLLSIEGLYDANITYANTSATTMTFSLFSDYGNVGSLTPIQGLVAGDFALFNQTTSTAVTILTAVESTLVKGTYTLTYASQTAGNVLRLTPTKTKIDFVTNVVPATSIVV